MTPPSGKIINIDAFKQKDESFSSQQKPEKERKLKIFPGRDNGYYVTLMVIVVAMALTFLVTPAKKRSITVPPLDSIASHNIKAPENLLIEDIESTEKNRQNARESALDVYDHDDRAIEEVTATIEEAFALMAKAYSTQADQAYRDTIIELQKIIESEQGEKAADSEQAEANRRKIAEAKASLRKFEQSEGFGKLETGFIEKLDKDLDKKILQTARYYHYWPYIGKIVTSALEKVYRRGIIASKSQLPASALNGITTKKLSDNSERDIRSLDKIYDIAEASQKVSDEISKLVPNDRPGMRNLARKIAIRLLKPDLTFNLKETESRKEKVAQSVQPVFFHIQQGEMIVREGDRITKTHVVKLNSMTASDSGKERLGVVSGFFLVILFIVVLAAFFLQKFHEEIVLNRKLQIFMGALLVVHIGLVWSTQQAASMFIPQTPGITLDTYLLAAPLVFGPMIVSIFFTAELTVLFTVVAAAITGLMLKDFSILPLLTIIGGMICAYQVRSYQKRLATLKVGIIVAMVNVLIAQAYNLTGPTAGFTEHQLYDAAFAFTGGALAGLLVSGALPLIESLFPVVSDIKLLELSNQNHPLLRRMIMEAPGSYHHSIMVGYLAEEACKAIGANSLLAKAGSLFHDIGKMKKPEYFVENHGQGQKNPHDKLTPSMSTLVITNHIKEGQEMAKKYRLLPQIAAMIPEHHGTQLVKYFYNKALEEQDESRNDVKESDFRYPGPIPSTRESACVALADSIEAAGRACGDPTPLRLMGIVTEVINDKFVQGQLDNSHLTLRDLALIADSFVHILTSIHHHRIEYPEISRVKERKAANADSYFDTKAKMGSSDS